MELTLENWKTELRENLDEEFPKGECKERGRALVFHAKTGVMIDKLLTHERLEFSTILNKLEEYVSSGEKYGQALLLIATAQVKYSSSPESKTDPIIK